MVTTFLIVGVDVLLVEKVIEIFFFLSFALDCPIYHRIFAPVERSESFLILSRSGALFKL